MATKKTSSGSSSTEKNIKKAATAVRKKNKTLFIVLVVIIVVAIVGVAIYGYYHGWFDALRLNKSNANYDVAAIKKETLSIHFLELGNGANGDSIYIKAGDTDILIDAGSEKTSAKSIGDYVDQYCTDGKLEYVIATHGDSDHIAGFVGTKAVPGIFDRYECETIIQFARTNKETAVYNDYCAKRDAEEDNGANVYTALECYNNANGAKSEYELAEGITMKILYQEYYEKKTSNENDYSVCLLITQDYTKDGKTLTNNYLLLGDLEEAGEKSLVANNPDLPQVVLYKGGHHGSKTSANEVLLSKIRPQIVCICCVAGSVEYLTSGTQNLHNTFPTQDFINRIAPYTDEVYATDVGEIRFDEDSGRYKDNGSGPLNGTIVFACTQGKITMYFSNNDTKLKDTEWFKANRDCPPSWQNQTVKGPSLSELS